MTENPETLNIPVFDWVSHDRDGVDLYIVRNTPGSPGLFLWNGHRWIDLDLPENTATQEAP